MRAEQQYLELFDKERDTLFRHSCDILNDAREDARRHFDDKGFPTRRDERCKYTDVSMAFAPDYGLNLTRIVPGVNPYATYRCQVPNLSTSLYFVVNDSVMPPAPTNAPLPEGVTLCPLREAARRFPDLMRNHYGHLADTAADGLTALNTMLAQDGLFIHVAAGTKCQRPIQIVNVSAAQIDLLSTRRVLIIAEEGAELSLLFCDHSDDRHRYVSTQVVETFVGRSARLHLYSIEETHPDNQRFSHLYVRQDEDSRFTLGSITLMAGLTRNRTDIRLVGKGAEACAYG